MSNDPARVRLARLLEEVVETADHGGIEISIAPVRGALSPKDAARWLDVSVPTVYRLMADDKLDYVNLTERTRRIAVSALQRFVDPHDSPA